MACLLGLVACYGPLQGTGQRAGHPEAAPQAAPEVPAEPEHLIILHTNDIHGQVLPLPATWIRDADPKPLVGGLERIARYIHQTREQAAKDGSDVLVIDAGDWFQGTPEGGLRKGRPLMQILARMGYDVVCVGNHEFDHGVQTLIEHLAAAPLPALLANVQEPSGSLLPGTEPYKIFERAGSRIGVVGILTTRTPAITHPSARQLVWNDEAETLRYWEARLQDQCDWILPVTHMGIEDDVELVRAVPGHPLLIGGHSHTLLRKGQKEGDTWITQAGSKARGVGRIDVWIDPETKRPVDIEIQVVNLFEGTVAHGEAPEVAAMCARAVAETEVLMREEVGSLAGDMPRGRESFVTSPLGNWVTDVAWTAVGGDLAVQNRGGLRANWKAGPITRRDLFAILPFDNSLVTLHLTGQELWEFLARQVAEGITLEISGAVLVLQADGSGYRLVRVEVGGQLLDREAPYRFVTNNYLAGGGDGMDELAFIQDREDHVELHRDVAERAIAASGPVTPDHESRYVLIEADPEGR